VLAALAATSVMVVVGDDDQPSFHVGIEWVAVLVCLASSPDGGTCSSGSSRGGDRAIARGGRARADACLISRGAPRPRSRSAASGRSAP
jgi:hypothetical protein